MSERWKSVISRVALATALVSALWLVVLIAWRGFTVKIFAVTISAHDPVRPLILAAIAIATFVVANGAGAAMAMARREFDRVIAALSRIDHRIPAGLLAIGI